MKVQDGCQHRCSFCIVPFARGGSRSQTVEAVVDQVEALVSAGHVEVVLTGVDLGHYGWDLQPAHDAGRAGKRLLDVRGLGWLRLSSVLPAYFTEELIELIVGDRRICRHLHVPLQSGVGPGAAGDAAAVHGADVPDARRAPGAAIPGLGLGADVIAGFPGETDADFEATAALVEALPFSYLHVFSYSDRRGTEAARGSVSPGRARDDPAAHGPAPEPRRRQAG